MTTSPKEKAKELVEKFTVLFETPMTKGMMIAEAQEAALIAVDEIIAEIAHFSETYCIDMSREEKIRTEYWEQVKEAINQL